MFMRAFLLFIPKAPDRACPPHASSKEVATSGREQGPPDPVGGPYVVQLVGDVQAAGTRVLSWSVQLQVQHQGVLAGGKGPGVGGLEQWQ